MSHPPLPGSNPSDPVAQGARESLRSSLLSARAIFFASAGFALAEESINRHVMELLAVLEPELLGTYWAVRSEFNLTSAISRAKGFGGPVLALPYAQSAAQSGADDMCFRMWAGETPTVRDECGIPSSAGTLVTPDVALVPCVGFTRRGYRMGYGGGYFDRWLAKHPFVTAVGVAWSGTEVEESAFAAQPHDIPLALIVTERGVVG